MAFLKYINIPAFLISLAIGIFFVYVTVPDMRKIYVYPTPENVDTVQYKDKTNSCFEFKQEKVSCPINESSISKIPPQS